MTQWDGILCSESESFRLESHWCVQSGFGNQPHYEAPGDLRVVLEIVLWLTSGEWDWLPPCQWLKVGLRAAKGLIKKVWTNFTFCVSVFIVVFDKQANICYSIGSISRLISSHKNNVTDRAMVMYIYQSYFKKLDHFLSGKQEGTVRTEQKIYFLFFNNFCMVHGGKDF